jgi:hypothetical protein
MVMRREPEFFGDQELVLIYVAKRLKEALAVERTFNEAEFDFAVVPTRYTGGLLFRSQRVGAFFYVTPQSAERARGLILEYGYRPFKG